MSANAGLPIFDNEEIKSLTRSMISLGKPSPVKPAPATQAIKNKVIAKKKVFFKPERETYMASLASKYPLDVEKLISIR